MNRFRLFGFNRDSFALVDTVGRSFETVAGVRAYSAVVFCDRAPEGMRFELSLANIHNVLRSGWFEREATVADAPEPVRNGIMAQLRKLGATDRERIALWRATPA